MSLIYLRMLRLQNQRHRPRRKSIAFHLGSLILFTYSDFKVIIIPQTCAGIFQALAGSHIILNANPSFTTVIARLPLIGFWNWYNVLMFNVANQRLPDSITEDQSNKPWRPIPAGRIDPNQARRLLFFLIPLACLLSYRIGGFEQTVTILILTYMYNDLGGGGYHYLTRNIINAFGFTCHASASTLIAAGAASTASLTSTAHIWFAMVGAIIFTTLQVQDLPDMEGDAASDRKTLPLVHGEWPTRLSTATFVFLWGILCPWFWNFNTSIGYMFSGIPSTIIAYRTLAIRNLEADIKTYKLWCFWLVLVYSLPLLRHPQSLADFYETPLGDSIR